MRFRRFLKYLYRKLDDLDIKLKGLKWYKIKSKQRKILLLNRSSLITLSVIGGIIIILSIWLIPQEQAKNVKDPKERGALENADRSTLVQTLGGLFLFVTTYFSLQNLKITQQNLVATQEKQVTERFAKAVEQLGNENIHVRIGAIYALERIAKDSDKDYWQVMEILTAYVRETSSYPSKDNTDNKPLWASVLSIHHENNHSTTTNNQEDIPTITTDIQAVLTVITRRKKSYEQGEENTLDLSKSNLRCARLRGADLSGANLSRAYLIGADLRDANLSDAILNGSVLMSAGLTNAFLRNAKLIDADLRDAFLDSADLTHASLSSANLRSAILYKTRLSGAGLNCADLSGAKLISADLSGAKLINANLNGADLSGANVSGADLVNLSRTNLSGADLSGADLTNADLTNADLTNADLTDTDLRGAKLSKANLKKVKNLTLEQLEKSEGWKQAKYDPEVRECLGLPPESKKQTE